MVKEVLESFADVLLFPRPRRFGKTLNMSMLKYFFEKTEHSHAHLFINTNICRYEEYRKLQGQYPIIYLTFKDTKEISWEESYKKLVTVISSEFDYHFPLIKPEVLASHLTRYNNIKNGTASRAEYSNSLKMLSELLFKSSGKRVIVLIDEYDVPIHSGYSNGFYKEVVAFIR